MLMRMPSPSMPSHWSYHIELIIGLLIFLLLLFLSLQLCYSILWMNPHGCYTSVKSANFLKMRGWSTVSFIAVRMNGCAHLYSQCRSNMIHKISAISLNRIIEGNELWLRRRMGNSIKYWMNDTILCYSLSLSLFVDLSQVIFFSIIYLSRNPITTLDSQMASSQSKLFLFSSNSMKLKKILLLYAYNCN